MAPRACRCRVRRGWGTLARPHATLLGPRTRPAARACGAGSRAPGSCQTCCFAARARRLGAVLSSFRVSGDKDYLHRSPVQRPLRGNPARIPSTSPSLHRLHIYVIPGVLLCLLSCPARSNSASWLAIQAGAGPWPGLGGAAPGLVDQQPGDQVLPMVMRGLWRYVLICFWVACRQNSQHRTGRQI